MAGYKYKLQNILNLRENIEKDKKNQFGAAMQRLEREKNRLAELYRELTELQQKLEAEASQGIPVNELKQLVDFVGYYNRSIANQKVKIKMAEDYLETCRQELIESTRNKKMMEKLKAIDYKEYQYEEQRKEDKLTDDLVTFRESRKDQE
ncbi:MAG: flagellar export protein FliJ [Bacillota bacterium]